MVIVETIGRVRREHFVKGKTIKEIARDLKISRNTVRKILRSEETSFSYDREVQPRPKLEDWSTDLDRFLTKNAGKPARERLTLIRIFEELRRLGYEGGYDAVRRTPPVFTLVPPAPTTPPLLTAPPVALVAPPAALVEWWSLSCHRLEVLHRLP